jgi:hypothetical protein
MDAARANDHFTTDSDGNLPRVLVHSQNSEEKSILKIDDWGRELVHFGISSFYEMKRITR